MEGKKIAAIRVRGNVTLGSDVKKTLNLLRLYRKNYCSVYENSPTVKGMLNNAKDHITYGEISEEIFQEILNKRGEEYKGRSDFKKCFTLNNKKIKPYFRLHPPVKGFERKGIKVPYSLGGALGYRGEKMSELIKKML